jgi:hypothetical protein
MTAVNLIYLACAATSVFCALLFVRSYRKTRTRLLLWSALCFVGLALNNVLLVVDRATPDVDLSVPRTLPAVAGVGLLLYGLIRDSK